MLGTTCSSRLEGVADAVSVSCGEAHALCVLRCGSVLAWGQNSCGQLGCGPSASGALADAFRPVLVAGFGSAHRLDAAASAHPHQQFLLKHSSGEYLRRLSGGGDSSGAVAARTACCGAFHSAVVDTNGLPWTWCGALNIFPRIFVCGTFIICLF